MLKYCFQNTRKIVTLLVLLISYPLAFADAQRAVTLLKKMNLAMQEQSYHGNFVYISGDKLESMVFVHSNDNGIVTERLYSLNGEAREIIRNDDALTCVLPDSQSIVIDNFIIKNQLPTQLPMELQSLSSSYDFKVLGTERVADLSTFIIAIQPKDSYRYGYKYWVDQASGLLVKASVMNENGTVIEQMMFTQLYIGDVDDALLQMTSNSGNYHRHQMKPQASSAANLVHDSQWHVRMLPHGFALKMHQYSSTSEAVEHFVFSDGMSSLSVFIEKKNKDRDVLMGASAMGAVNAFGRYHDGFHITTVGEVPAETVRLVGEALSLKP